MSFSPAFRILMLTMMLWASRQVLAQSHSRVGVSNNVSALFETPQKHHESAVSENSRYDFEPPDRVASVNPFSHLFVEVSQSQFDDSPTLLTWAGQAPGSVDRNAPMATDRPDVTEASSTVGPGVLQIETGYTYARDGNGSSLTETHSFPEALFRYGTPINWLELRLATTLAHETTVLEATTGVPDLYLGVKIGLTLQDGILPEMALVPQMTVPSGSSAFTDDQVLPGANWLYGWDINDFVSTAGGTQFNRSVDPGTGSIYTEWTQTWTIGYSLHDRVGAYTEWFAFIPQDSDTAHTEHYANGGFTFLITDDIQWDIRAGTGLNDNAADFFAGTGLSFRFR